MNRILKGVIVQQICLIRSVRNLVDWSGVVHSYVREKTLFWQSLWQSIVKSDHGLFMKYYYRLHEYHHLLHQYHSGWYDCEDLNRWVQTIQLFRSRINISQRDANCITLPALSKAPTMPLFSVLPVPFPMCPAKESPWWFLCWTDYRHRLGSFTFRFLSWGFSSLIILIFLKWFPPPFVYAKFLNVFQLNDIVQETMWLSLNKWFSKYCQTILMYLIKKNDTIVVE